MTAHPPAYVNGKKNPAYQIWYRANHPQAVSKYNHSEKAAACRARYQSGKGMERARVAAEKLHEENKRVHRDEVFCIGCEMTFTREAAIIRNFRFLPYAGNRVLCDDCRG